MSLTLIAFNALRKLMEQAEVGLDLDLDLVEPQSQSTQTMILLLRSTELHRLLRRSQEA
jgi:hypothetical protein